MSMYKTSHQETPGLTSSEYFMTATELADLIRSGRASASEVAESYIRRISRYDQAINSFVTVDPEQVLAQARAADLSLPEASARFHGVPIAIKDLTSTAGLRTTFSSRAFQNTIPDKDSPVVSLIKSAGFVTLGKTNTPEFGILPVTESGLNGICVNPWDPSLTAGGSSGGSAAAVAAGLAPIAHGSDGAGSLRIPASCCGTFAITPGPGRLPPSSRITLGNGPVDGVISRTVADAGFFLSEIGAITAAELSAGLAPADDRGRPIRPVRIGLACQAPLGFAVDAQCVTAAELAARMLAELMLHVEPVRLPEPDPRLLEDLMLLRSSMPVAFGNPPGDALDGTTRAAMDLARRATAVQVHEALVRVAGYAAQIRSVFRELDLLLTPTLAMLPVPHGWITGAPSPAESFRRSAQFSPFAVLANIAGLPAASLPLHRSPSGLPVGAQLICAPTAITVLLAVCRRLEELSQWSTHAPRVPSATATRKESHASAQ
jgi:amidase